MKDSEKIRILDDKILALEAANEKVDVMINALDQDYFSLDKDGDKLYFFDRAVTQHNILMDYVWQIGNTLAEAREMLREWSAEKEKDR